MDEMDFPNEPDDLYRDRGGQVSVALPLMQGDVFDDIQIPCLSDKPMRVQVVMHPCSMRAGKTVRSSITVAPVKSFSGGTIGQKAWQKNLNSMLLPSLDEAGEAPFYTDLRELAPVKTSELYLASRSATLSGFGVLLLQQRHAFSLTRYAIPLSDLEQQMLPILTEMELQETWVEGVLAASQDSSEGSVSKASDAFQDWLDEDGGIRRAKLQQASAHAELRRECAVEVRS